MDQDFIISFEGTQFNLQHVCFHVRQGPGALHYTRRNQTVPLSSQTCDLASAHWILPAPILQLEQVSQR